MNGKKWIAAGVLTATVMFGSMGSVSAAGEGYVNLPAVFASSPEAQQAGRTVAQAQQTLQAQFAKQSPGMSAQDKSALQQRLNQQLRDTQRDALGPVQKKIAQAIETLKNGGRLVNFDVEIFKGRYDSSSYSIFNYLARQYGVKIPIKTQGWINSSLLDITVKDGKMSGGHMSGKNQSTVIYKYMNQLIEAVRKDA